MTDREPFDRPTLAELAFDPDPGFTVADLENAPDEWDLAEVCELCDASLMVGSWKWADGVGPAHVACLAGVG